MTDYVLEQALRILVGGLGSASRRDKMSPGTRR